MVMYRNNEESKSVEVFFFFFGGVGKRHPRFLLFKLSETLKLSKTPKIVEGKKEVESFKNGKTKLLGFYVGQLMKRTKGKADPKLANKLLSEKVNG